MPVRQPSARRSASARSASKLAKPVKSRSWPKRLTSWVAICDQVPERPEDDEAASRKLGQDQQIGTGESAGLHVRVWRTTRAASSPLGESRPATAPGEGTAHEPLRRIRACPSPQGEVRPRRKQPTLARRLLASGSRRPCAAASFSVALDLAFAEIDLLQRRRTVISAISSQPG